MYWALIFDRRSAWLGLMTLCSFACKSPQQEEVLHGTILFPFQQNAEGLGHNQPSERFIVRSIIGNTEYTIEIPDAAKDYDIFVPLADLGADLGQVGSASKERSSLGSSRATGMNRVHSATTDREFIGEFPPIEGRSPEETALVDAAFGVGKSEGPGQGPSYTMRLAKITELYKTRQYEMALIEINGLLSYHPNSPRLHKMKGTILVKLRHYDLALGAWIRAFELQPDDGKTKKAIAILEKKIESNRRTSMLQPQTPDKNVQETPKEGISTNNY